MGLEKNSDAVVMECYAPLFVNVNPADPGEGIPEGVAMEHEPDRVRRPAELRLAELPRPGDARPEQGRRRARHEARRSADHAGKNDTPQGRIGVGSWHTMAEYRRHLRHRAGRPDTAHGQSTLRTPNDGNSPAATGKSAATRSCLPTAMPRPGRSPATRAGPTTRSVCVPASSADAKGSSYCSMRPTAQLSVVEHRRLGQHGHPDGGRPGRRPHAVRPGASFTVETGRWYDLRLESRAIASADSSTASWSPTRRYEPGTTSTPVYATATHRP